MESSFVAMTVFLVVISLGVFEMPTWLVVSVCNVGEWDAGFEDD